MIVCINIVRLKYNQGLRIAGVGGFSDNIENQYLGIAKHIVSLRTRTSVKHLTSRMLPDGNIIVEDLIPLNSIK